MISFSVKNNFYIKFIFKYDLIKPYIEKWKIQKVNFYIDLLSVTTGFYSKRTILMEINEYLENNRVSNLLIFELKNFLNYLYSLFTNFDPYFVLFYDDGFCQQNTAIFESYKKDRNPLTNDFFFEQQEYEIMKQVKNYYFNLIPLEFNKADICSVFYWKEYETDLVPYFCINKNLFESQNPDVLNIIFSKDKDLLQTLQFNNTIMYINKYKQRSETKVIMNVYDDENAFEYVYPKFKRGILTSKYIPLFLSICGDPADSIEGIKGFGPAKTIQLLQNNSLPHKLNKKDLHTYPKIIQDNFDKIMNNYKLIAFEEQLKRIPEHILFGG